MTLGGYEHLIMEGCTTTGKQNTISLKNKEEPAPTSTPPLMSECLAMLTFLNLLVMSHGWTSQETLCKAETCQSQGSPALKRTEVK